MKFIKKGRASLTNPTGRFETIKKETFLEDILSKEQLEDEISSRTQIHYETVRTLINTNQSPDIPFSSSINPYRGCEHGCIYCYARPSHGYLGYSTGLDFETQIFAKTNACEALLKQIQAKAYKPQIIVLGANTDPYQPLEAKLQITKNILEILYEHRHPVHIITKSSLILRDLELLKKLSNENLLSISISLTTLDAKLASKMEPRASTPVRRLEAIQELSKNKIRVGVMTSPIILGLNDEELESLLKSAVEAGASRAHYVLLRLPFEVKDLFVDWLEEHYPERKKRILKHIQDSRGGKLYDSTWGKRFRGEGAQALLLTKRFTLSCKKLGLNQGIEKLDLTKFKKKRSHN